jgi:hypothetical protein
MPPALSEKHCDSQIDARNKTTLLVYAATEIPVDNLNPDAPVSITRVKSRRFALVVVVVSCSNFLGSCGHPSNKATPLTSAAIETVIGNVMLLFPLHAFNCVNSRWL